MNVKPCSRAGLIRYKITSKYSLSGPFCHSGEGRNPGVAEPVRSYNLVLHTPVSPWPGTTWSTASTSPSKLSISERPPTGATARHWAWTCAGRTGSSAGTTRRAAATCSLTTPPWKECGNWKTRSGACRADSRWCGLYRGQQRRESDSPAQGPSSSMGPCRQTSAGACTPAP